MQQLTSTYIWPDGKSVTIACEFKTLRAPLRVTGETDRLVDLFGASPPRRGMLMTPSLFHQLFDQPGWSFLAAGDPIDPDRLMRKSHGNSDSN